ARAVSPWQPLGSPAARSPALLASGGHMTVVADDWSPNAAPRTAPCVDSCTCLDGGAIDLATGGLFAFTDDVARQVASGRDDRGFYGRREQIAAIDAGGRIVIAATQSIDRNAELFASSGDIWQPLLATPAPIPMWIGALGTADNAAWLGAKPEEGQQATVQRLVAGVVDGELELLDEPADRSVLLVEPVPTPAGVTTNILVQGVFERTGGQLRWARFEVIAVDAVWP
ncbi:MAG: hypothetical protein M4D80_23460, partial [Myxococcota bacterium]|nr:hypothetical protein [Myxococcota bacterium]